MHITASACPHQDIDRVIFDDEIYGRITDDNCPKKEEFHIPYMDAQFVGGYVDGEIASLFVVHGRKMHFMVLKAYRMHANDLLRESFRLWPHTVYVVIPSLYKSVINFARKFGFVETKVERASHLKNGQLYDLHTMIYEV